MSPLCIGIGHRDFLYIRLFFWVEMLAKSGKNSAKKVTTMVLHSVILMIKSSANKTRLDSILNYTFLWIQTPCMWREGVYILQRLVVVGRRFFHKLCWHFFSIEVVASCCSIVAGHICVRNQNWSFYLGFTLNSWEHKLHQHVVVLLVGI